MANPKEYVEAARGWYEAQRSPKGHVNTNVMTTGLIVSRMIRGGLPITEKRLRSKNRSQVRGLSGSAVGRILQEYGEYREFTSEGGRTSRGTLPLADSYRQLINGMVLDPPWSENDLAGVLEAYFVGRISEDFFDKQRLEVEIDPDKPVAAVVTDILNAAAQRADKPTGDVLQHLVGAKLQLRFPDAEIGVDKANAADQQTDREGDFQLGNTAFHVTVAPMEKLIARCISNKRAGYRPVILTPIWRVSAARTMLEIADPVMAAKVGVVAAEEFIGTNIEEIGNYDGDAIRRSVAELVRTYNERIDAIETDKSLMIEEPRWLVKLLEDQQQAGSTG